MTGAKVECYNPPMITHRQVLALWGERPYRADRIISDDLGIRDYCPRDWRIRSNIPARFWLRLMRSADKHGIEGVTLEVLAYGAENSKQHRKLDL